MNKGSRAQNFDREGRENLSSVVKHVKNYLSVRASTENRLPSKVVFFTLKGEGPMIAYNQLSGLNLSIIAVVFPPTYSVLLMDGSRYCPEIPDKVIKFFRGVEIPIIRGRLPFDEINGAESHNSEMKLIQSVLSVFGGSIPLAIQAVLQATDSGEVRPGEQVISVTSDTALLITASTTKDFLSKSCGLVVNEVICKPRVFDISRPPPKKLEGPEILPLAQPAEGLHIVEHSPFEPES